MSKREKYGSWDEQLMERALAAYRNGELGLNAVSRTYRIPKATLKRRIDGTNIRATEHIKAFGRNVDLPLELENELVKCALLLKERFFGLSRNDLKRLAFQLAESNNIPHRFNKNKKMAGDKWCYGFMSRHPELTLRPRRKSTSMARGKDTEEPISTFCNLQAEIVDKNRFSETNIFNMDEAILSANKKPLEVLALKGKQVVECKGRKRSTGDLSEEGAINKTDEPSGSSEISDNLISLENALQDSELVYSTQDDGQPSQTRIDDWTLKEEQEKISEHGDGIQHESLLGGQDSVEDYKMASLNDSYHNDVTGTKRRKVTGLEDSISLDSYQECKDQKQILKRILDKVDDLDNPIFSFFRSMAQTVAQFPPHIIAETRVRVCQLIGEMEVKASQEQVLKSSQGYFHKDSPSQASQSKTSKRTINETTTQVETIIPTAIPPQSSSSYSDKTQIFIKSELILESDDE